MQQQQQHTRHTAAELSYGMDIHTRNVWSVRYINNAAWGMIHGRMMDSYNIWKRHDHTYFHTYFYCSSRRSRGACCLLLFCVSLMRLHLSRHFWNGHTLIGILYDIFFQRPTEFIIFIDPPSLSPSSSVCNIILEQSAVCSMQRLYSLHTSYPSPVSLALMIHSHTHIHS